MSQSCICDNCKELLAQEIRSRTPLRKYDKLSKVVNAHPCLRLWYIDEEGTRMSVPFGLKVKYCTNCGTRFEEVEGC